MRLDFKLEAQASQSRARAGRFRTLHNEVLTPLFMPVGTHATVRGLAVEPLLESGSQILLANTYHLLLRPGPQIFEKFGGIHSFMKWPRSVLTDSGGFQIFALPHSRTMTEDYAEFRSYVDGAWIKLSPEVSIGMQKSIGSDIMMVLDQCIDSTSDYTTAKNAMELTHRWALRSLKARGDSPQSLFGIVQGACYKDLRIESARFITSQPFDGFAIGGLAVGETKEQREEYTEIATDLLPRQNLRYLMGVGTPIDLLEAVHRGVDMFDCIIPTAFAQQGVVFTWNGKINLKRNVYQESERPIDENCACPTCQKYSRAYLHHLVKVGELLFWQLLGQHNVYFYHELMRTMRDKILSDTFYSFYLERRQTLALQDEEFPSVQPKHKKYKKLELGHYRILKPDAEKGLTEGRIEHMNSGEIMHSVSNPSDESQKLYLEQSQVMTLIQKQPITIWDIGLGAASNSMNTILAYEKLFQEQHSLEVKLNRLTIQSFENDCDSLKLACKHPKFFPYLQHPAPHQLLKHQQWRSQMNGDIEWTLIEDDFLSWVKTQLKILLKAQLKTVDSQSKQESVISLPDIIYYDPFSYKTNPDFWGLEAFSNLYELLDLLSNATTSVLSSANLSDSLLITYSSATRVRAALLAAGFYVYEGIATGPKSTTTLASRIFRNDLKPLGSDWCERWERSDVHFEQDHSKVLERIKNHPQFSL